MSLTFEQIKKRHNLEALIKSLILGLSLGALSVGLVLLVVKLVGASLWWLYFLIIGLGVMGIASAVAFLFLRRNDIQMATYLDEKLQLPEKIQTMIEFDGQEGDLIEIQRNDAQKVLQTTPLNVSFFKRFLVCIVSLCISISMLVTGIVVPAKADDVNTNSTDLGFTVTQWQLNAVGELIEYVHTSDMQEEAKTLTVSTLEALKAKLPNIDIRRYMVAEVVSAIMMVDTIVESVNSYKVLAVKIYATSNEQLKHVAKTLLELSGIAYNEKLNEIREAFTGDELQSTLNAFSVALAGALVDIEVISEDKLKNAFSLFAQDIAQIAQDNLTGTTTDAQIQNSIDDAFKRASDGIGSALSMQYENKVVRDYIKDALIKIFKLNANEVPPLPGDAIPVLRDSEDENFDEGKDPGSGSPGDGSDLYASSDKIYDPFGEEGGEYKPYGEAYDDYYKIVEGLMIEQAFDDDLLKFITNYFNKLSNGLKPNDGN